MADRNIRDEANGRDIFISYSSKDKETVRKLKQAVNSLQYTAFFDEVALPGSPEWDKEISKNLNSCKMVLFYRTENSVASQWCARELRMAEQKHKKIVPVVNRSRQNCLPDSLEMQALLVNLQNTFIDETEKSSVIKENLRQTLENCIGKGTGNFGEMTDILNDLLRQAAAAMNKASREPGGDQEKEREGNLIQYGYDGDDGAQFYRELNFGNLTAVFRMVCRRWCRPRKCGENKESCRNCGIKGLCLEKKDRYVIDTYVQILKGSVKHGNTGPFLNALRGIEVAGSRLKNCPSEEELLFDRMELGSLPCCKGRKNESNAFSAVLRLISEAQKTFPVIETAVHELQERADSWNKFLNEFSEDAELNRSYRIYRDDLIFSLIPKQPTCEKQPEQDELGIYDSIEIARPNVMRVRFDSLFSGDRHEIRFERFEANRLIPFVLALENPFSCDPSDLEVRIGDVETSGRKDAILIALRDAVSKSEYFNQSDTIRSRDLKVTIRGVVQKLKESKVEDRISWKAEEEIRKRFRELILALRSSFCDWKMTSDHDKVIFTLVGSYFYSAWSPTGDKTIVSPLRLKVAVNRKKMVAGRVLFHVDDAKVPTLAAEPGGEKAEEHEAPAFCPLDKPGSEAFFQGAFSLKDEKGKFSQDRLKDFMSAAIRGWNEIREFIEEARPGKSDTLSALRNNVVKKMEKAFFRHQGGVLADLSGDRIKLNVPKPEDNHKRIAWSLQMDHRLYRDFSQYYKGQDPIPFCPFVQFIGPGMKKWATGWETTQEFRSLPRSVKFFFWRVIFGKSGMAAHIEENGNSIFFDEAQPYSGDKFEKSSDKLDSPLREMGRAVKRISTLWRCISGASDDMGCLKSLFGSEDGNVSRGDTARGSGREGAPPASQQEPSPAGGNEAVPEENEAVPEGGDA